MKKNEQVYRQQEVDHVYPSSFAQASEQVSYERETVLERRHVLATAATRLDQDLRNIDELQELDARQIEDWFLSDIPEANKAVFREVAQAFTAALYDAREMEGKLDACLKILRECQVELGGLREQFIQGIENSFRAGKKKLKLPPTPVSMQVEGWEAALTGVPELVFYLRTGRAPKGDVTFTRSGIYFILSCSDERDYLQITGGNSIPDPVYIHSSGLFYQSIGMNVKIPGDSHSFSFSFPMIVVNEKNAEGEREGIVRHEVRHFINHILLKKKEAGASPFDQVERGLAEGDLSRVAIQRDIKDEVIAYLDQGEQGLADALGTDLYEHLFKDLSQEEYGRYMDTLRSIEEKLNENMLWKRGSEEGRLLLIYHLMDVPLLRIPRWLSIVDDFYRERVAHLDECALPLDELDVFCQRAGHDEAERMRTIAKDLERIFDRAEVISMEVGKPGIYEKNLRKCQRLKAEALKLLDGQANTAPLAA